MNAFKNWESEEGCLGTYICPDVPCRDCTKQRERGWKAALQWIYNEGALSQSDIAGTAIKKELEGV